MNAGSVHLTFHPPELRHDGRSFSGAPSLVKMPTTQTVAEFAADYSKNLHTIIQALQAVESTGQPYGIQGLPINATLDNSFRRFGESPAQLQPDLNVSSSIGLNLEIATVRNKQVKQS